MNDILYDEMKQRVACDVAREVGAGLPGDEPLPEETCARIDAAVVRTYVSGCYLAEWRDRALHEMGVRHG